MATVDVETVIYREGDYVVAQCLNVDVSSFGESEDDAVANLSEALELYFEDAPEAVVAPIEAASVRRLSERLAGGRLRLIAPPGYILDPRARER